VTSYGTFNVSPPPGAAVIPVNYGTGPALFTFNLRLSKTFGFGKRVEAGATAGGAGGRGGGGYGGRGGGGPGGGLGGRGLSGSNGSLGLGNVVNRRYGLTFSIAARNLFNYVDLAPPVGNLNSPLFGQSNALAGMPFTTSSANRRIDLQLMFTF
jgi:hypothetical protein